MNGQDCSYLRPNTAHSRPVVGNFFPGFDELIVDTVTKMINERHSGQDGVIPAQPNTNHLTINPDYSC